jgi:hypothetical protein
MRSRLRFGGRGKSFQGERYYTAANPPYGATLTYYLKDAIKTKRQMRQVAEPEATAVARLLHIQRVINYRPAGRRSAGCRDYHYGCAGECSPPSGWFGHGRLHRYLGYALSRCGSGGGCGTASMDVAEAVADGRIPRNAGNLQLHDRDTPGRRRQTVATKQNLKLVAEGTGAMTQTDRHRADRVSTKAFRLQRALAGANDSVGALENATHIAATRAS